MYNIIINNASDAQPLLDRFPHATTVDWQDPTTITITNETTHTWILDSRVDYSRFDLTKSPLPWEEHQIHVYNDHTVLKPHTSNGEVHYHTTSTLRLLEPVPQHTVNNATADDIHKLLKTASTKHIWIISDNVDYSNFNFNYTPSIFEDDHLHVWSTKNNEFSTMLVPKTFDSTTSITSYSKINYHKQLLQTISPGKTKFPVIIREYNNDHTLKKQFPHAVTIDKDAELPMVTTPTWLLSSLIDYSNFNFDYVPSPYDQDYNHEWLTEQNDFGDTFLLCNKKQTKYHHALNYLKEHNDSFYTIAIMNMGNNDNNVKAIKEKYPQAKVVRYTDHISTMNRLVAKATTSHIWVLSSNIDYSDFNLDYRPGKYEKDHLHCWKTHGQSFGDTFLIPVKQWRELNPQSLLDFKPINYNHDSLGSLQQESKNYLINDIFILDQGNKANIRTLQNRFPAAKILRYTDLNNSVNRAVTRAESKFIWVLSSLIDYSEFDFNWRAPPWEEDQLHVWGTVDEEFGHTFLINSGQWEYLDRLVDHSQINYTHEPLYRLPTVDSILPDIFLHDRGGDLSALCALYPNIKILTAVDSADALKQALAQTTTQTVWLLSSNVDYIGESFDLTQTLVEFDSGHFKTWLTDGRDLRQTILSQSVSYPAFLSLNARPEHSLSSCTHNSLVLSCTVLIITGGNHPSNLQHLSTLFPSAHIIPYTNTVSHLVAIQEYSGYVWVLSDSIDYSDFDFGYSMAVGEEDQLHCWGSLFGHTMYLNVDRIKSWSLTDIPVHTHEYNNVLPDEVTCAAYPMVMMDMGGHDISLMVELYPDMVVGRWAGDHLRTIVRLVKGSGYTWVLSSCVDYTGFDFSYRPEVFEEDQIHCWPSEDQKFGDTFLIPGVLLPQLKDITQLTDMAINYNHTPLQRRAWQEVVYVGDNLLSVINETSCSTPYVVVRHINEHVHINQPSLWHNRPVVALTPSHASSLVPRDVFGNNLTQLYSYPYLEKEYVGDSKPLDVIFISNGESNAEENWQHLLRIVPNAKRVMNVNGRAQAYREAAYKSDTSWFLAVFAKLHVNKEFDFNWQPDYWQEPKHYIFHALNPINGLEYGHQAMIAYNKELTLTNEAKGLDFTLDQAHAVIPIRSGTANYADDPWMAWRTAFREVLKLKESNAVVESIETRYRIKQWIKVGNGEFGEWSTKGAQDGSDYYDMYKDDFASLKLSYEWNWLKEFYTKKYT